MQTMFQLCENKERFIEFCKIKVLNDLLRKLLLIEIIKRVIDLRGLLRKDY